MSAKKQKLRDTTNLTPEDAGVKAATSTSDSDSYSTSSAIADNLLRTHCDASARSLEQHFIATVHAVLHSLRQSCSRPVPWSAVAVSVA